MVCVSPVRERERVRQTETDRQKVRQRQRKRQRDRETERDRDRVSLFVQQCVFLQLVFISFTHSLFNVSCTSVLRVQLRWIWFSSLETSGEEGFNNKYNILYCVFVRP